MQSRAWLYEQRAIGVAASLLLAAKLIPCITDVNHPPGARWVRLAAAALVLGIAVLEYFRPWRGVMAALVAWPHMLVLREVLFSKATPLFAAMPAFWGGAMAAGLGVAIWLRLERTGEAANEPTAWNKRWRIALWLLAAGIVIGTIAGTVRTFSRPPLWQCTPTDLRHLLDPGVFTDWMPILTGIEILPPVLLGLLLLNAATRPPALPRGAVMACLVINGLIMTAEVGYQILTGSTWAFDASPPSGPFANRNITAPLLAIFGACAIAWARTAGGFRRIAMYGAAAIMLMTAVATGSRNGAFAVAALLMLWLLSGTLAGGRAAKLRIGVAVAALALIAIIVFYAPMPKAETIKTEALRRGVETVEAMRAGDWSVFSGERFGLYKAALHIYEDYPLTGSGPGTIPMQLWDKGPYVKDVSYWGEGHWINHAHSIPMQLLAECGLLALAGWVLAWVALPIGFILRIKDSALWALPLATLGIANLFDGMWLSPGVPTLGVILLVIAAASSADQPLKE